MTAKTYGSIDQIWDELNSKKTPAVFRPSQRWLLPVQMDNHHQEDNHLFTIPMATFEFLCNRNLCQPFWLWKFVFNLLDSRANRNNVNLFIHVQTKAISSFVTFVPNKTYVYSFRALLSVLLGFYVHSFRTLCLLFWGPLAILLGPYVYSFKILWLFFRALCLFF